MVRNFFIAFLCCLAVSVSAQQPGRSIDAGTWQQFTYDLGSIFGGVGYSYSRPLYWGGQQWGNFALLVGATGGSYLADVPVSDFFIGIREDVPKFIRDYGWEIGSPANNYMLTGGVYLTGLFLKDPKLRRTGVLLVASATSAGFLQQVLKSAIGRARPSSGLGKATFSPLWPGNNDFHSFPSGRGPSGCSTGSEISAPFHFPEKLLPYSPDQMDSTQKNYSREKRLY